MIAADEIRERLDKEPFVPFRLGMSSGKTYSVVNPASAVVLKREIFIAFPDGERWSLVPFVHISSVEAIKNGPSRKNGRKRRPE